MPLGQIRNIIHGKRQVISLPFFFWTEGCTSTYSDTNLLNLVRVFQLENEGMFAICCGLHGDKTMHWSLRVSLNSKIYCLIFKFQLDSPEKVIRQVTSLNHRQRNKDFRAEYLKVPYIFPGHHESLPVW